MYEELAKLLRNKRRQICPICREAADAIEELSMKLHGDEAAIAGMKREIEYMARAEKPHWIPVAERLPSNSTKVLVFEFGRVEQAYTTTYTADGSLCWVVINGGSYHRISDADCPIKWWMPLPQPPKE